MIKPFLIVLLVLLLSVVCLAGHYFAYNRVLSQEANQKISALTHLSSPVLSVAYYEPRILFYEVASNPAYPQMQAINRMDFVYEK